MAKKNKSKAHGIMGRSDIPYAQRIAMQHQHNIVMNRDHAAKVAMYCLSVAMHEEEGVGYKRLVRFSFRHQAVIEEFYEDTEVGMVHATQRMEQMGMPISGELFTYEAEGQTKREREIGNHRLQAVQIALICGAIAMNDEFGFGQERQTRISERANEYSARYAKEGEKFLLDKMEELGFAIIDGEANAFVDDDGNAISEKKWREQNAEM